MIFPLSLYSFAILSKPSLFPFSTSTSISSRSKAHFTIFKKSVLALTEDSSAARCCRISRNTPSVRTRNRGEEFRSLATDSMPFSNVSAAQVSKNQSISKRFVSLNSSSSQLVSLIALCLFLVKFWFFEGQLLFFMLIFTKNYIIC